MQHLKLLGGKTPEELWPLTNACIPGLLLLLLAPKWTHTKTLSLIGPIFMAFIYTLSLLSVMFYPEVDPDPAANFTSLEGVMAIFKDETGVFIGWVHYIVFDPLVARWIVLDSITEKKFALVTHLVVVVPCFILTILFGPMGFLLYMMLRSFLPPSSLNKVKSG